MNTKRKIVKQGAATLMISLPSKWAKQNHLDKGDEVDVQETSDELIISKKTKQTKKEITLDISSEIESSVRTIITSAYRLGYDKLIVNFSNKNIAKIIKDVVENQLLGFEIIKETEGKCEIGNITEPSAEQFDNIFGKVLLNIEEMFSITNSMIYGKKSEFEDIEQKIIEFDNFCRRVISKNRKGENYQLKWAFHIALNRGQRELYHLLKYLEKNKIQDQKNVLRLLIQCREIFIMLKDAYYEKDIVLIERLHEKDKNVYSLGYDLLKKGKDCVAIHRLLASTRQFYLASSPLAGVIISIENFA